MSWPWRSRQLFYSSAVLAQPTLQTHLSHQVLGLLEEARSGRAISGPVIERAGSSPLSPSSANALFANANTVRASIVEGASHTVRA